MERKTVSSLDKRLIAENRRLREENRKLRETNKNVSEANLELAGIMKMLISAIKRKTITEGHN
ncbi:hypothetical protein [Petroclostridium sp. X23]|uniref:hypothetical protein n=1 Tax=Petroclostridium sp. X23 TaxID=3045146 RepID=UPI0024AE635B|nr:hypothetical protein [Petroclostridium sp. X23]WHH58467.1 hypothetical protein QKW49_22140 [Petroclostridium sp. X23]